MIDEATFRRAVRQVLEDNTASVLNLRNKLHIDHTEAMECINRMEKERLIGPYQSPLARTIHMKAIPAKYR